MILKNKIKLLLLDVDGVMTDGSIIMGGDGELLKEFNVKDGLAIELLHLYGIKVGIISGKTSPALVKRCDQLELDFVVTNCKNKLPEVMNISSVNDIDLKEIAFCGDDVIDIPVFEKVGFSIAPKDAHSLVIDAADCVTNAKGGKGVVREIADYLLVQQCELTLKEIYKPLLKNISSGQTDTLHQ